MTSSVFHAGVWWSQTDEGLVYKLDESTQEWIPWDPDDDGPIPPESLGSIPGDFASAELVASEVRAVWHAVAVIAVIAAIALAIFFARNMSEANDESERNACRIIGTC